MTLEVASRPARLVWSGVELPVEVAMKEGVSMYIILFKYRTFLKRVWLFKSHVVVRATGNLVKLITNKQLDVLWRADIMEPHTITFLANARIGDIVDTNQGL